MSVLTELRLSNFVDACNAVTTEPVSHFINTQVHNATVSFS